MHVHFDLWPCVVSFFGGVLIAIVTSVFVVFTGTVTGISGVVRGLIRPWGKELLPWKGSFLVGLCVSGALYYALPSDLRYVAFGPDEFPLRWWVCVVSGLLVGFGSSMANGCTSGHGLCGVARLSPRSLVFTMIFFAVGILTASLTRASFSYDDFYTARGTAGFSLGTLYVLPLVGVAVLQLLVCWSRGEGWWRSGMSVGDAMRNWKLQVVSLLGGFFFGVALILTGMSNALKILDFLDFTGEPDGWDPQLLFCCVGAMGTNVLTFYFLHIYEHPPLLASDTKPVAKYINYGMCPANKNIDAKLLAGGLLFGIGWGLSGICPGPAVVNYITGRDYFGVLLPCMILGMQIEDAVAAAREYYKTDARVVDKAQPSESPPPPAVQPQPQAHLSSS